MRIASLSSFFHLLFVTMNIYNFYGKNQLQLLSAQPQPTKTPNPETSNQKNFTEAGIMRPAFQSLQTTQRAGERRKEQIATKNPRRKI